MTERNVRVEVQLVAQRQVGHAGGEGVDLDRLADGSLARLVVARTEHRQLHLTSDAPIAGELVGPAAIGTGMAAIFQPRSTSEHTILDLLGRMRADTTHDRPDLAFVAVVAIAARTGFLAIPAVAAGHEQIRPLRRREARLKTGRELLPAIKRRILARVVLVVQPVVLAHQVGMPPLREATLDRSRSVKTFTVTPNAAAVAGIQAVVLGDVGITLGQGQRPAALAGLRRSPVVLQ